MNTTEAVTAIAQLTEILAIMYKIVEATGANGMPSGHFYVNLIGHMTYDEYSNAIAVLKRMELIREDNHVLYALPVPARRTTI